MIDIPWYPIATDIRYPHFSAWFHPPLSLSPATSKHQAASAPSICSAALRAPAICRSSRHFWWGRCDPAATRQTPSCDAACCDRGPNADPPGIVWAATSRDVLRFTSLGFTARKVIYDVFLRYQWKIWPTRIHLDSLAAKSDTGDVLRETSLLDSLPDSVIYDVFFKIPMENGWKWRFRDDGPIEMVIFQSYGMLSSSGNFWDYWVLRSIGSIMMMFEDLFWRLEPGLPIRRENYFHFQLKTDPH